VKVDLQAVGSLVLLGEFQLKVREPGTMPEQIGILLKEELRENK